MMALNWLDFAMIGVMGLSGLVGLVRGLVREVLSLVSWGLAIWVGITFSSQTAVFLEQTIPSPAARTAAAFGILFLLTLMLAGMVGFLLTRMLETTGLSGIDRVAGLLFGVARGVLIIAVLVFLARETPLPKEAWWRESQLIPLFQSLALWLSSQIPPGFMKRVSAKPLSNLI
jgi:membrane protein required for colicin V production